MHNHCINKLLNIEDVIVKKVSYADSFIKIYLETKPKEHICPVCGSSTKRIHDYRMQAIRDLPFQLKHYYLVIRKRRYLCSCGKRFYENYSFLPRYFQRTSRLTAFIADALYDTCSVSSVAQTFFPNATIVIDKYHFIRQTTWAIESVRKRLQKTMPANLRKYYKRSRRLILTRYEKLKDENKKAYDLMLLYNDDLRLAHYLKEWFYHICQNPKYSEQRKEFWEWISTAEQSQLPEFEKCAATYRHWSREILNAFKYSHLTNGPTEGFNNKIKVLKRSSYGIRNFKHFRTRILLTTQ